MGWLAYVDTEEHPATRFLGTTWIKLEDVFIKATSSNGVSGTTGGSNTIIISKANLPAVKVQVDTFSVTTKKYTHQLGIAQGYYNSADLNSPTGSYTSRYVSYIPSTLEGGGDTTGTASPYTSALGSGTALDITPAYYTVHIWKRLS